MLSIFKRILIKIKKFYKIQSILLVSTFIKSEKNIFRRCLFSISFISFFISLIITFIYILQDGVQKKFEDKLISIHGDLRVSLPKDISYNEMKELVRELTNFLKIDVSNNINYVVPIGLHQVILKNYIDEIKPCFLLTVDSNFFEFYKFKVKKLPKGTTVITGKGLYENSFFEKSNALLIFSGEFDEISKQFSYEHASISCYECFDFLLEEWNENIILMEALAYQNLTDNNPFTHICIYTNNKKASLFKIKKNIFDKFKLDSFYWFESFKDIGDSFLLQKSIAFFSIILLLFLSLFCTFNFFKLFLVGNQEKITALYIQGFSMRHLFIWLTILVPVILFISYVIGSLLSFLFIFIGNNFEFFDFLNNLNFSYNGSGIYFKEILFLSSINFIFCFFILISFLKRIKKNFY